MIRYTNWTTRDGKVRQIRLFKAWRNLNDRCAGHNKAGDGSRPWIGIKVEFKSWEDFREWAIENGYSKERNSLDRRDGNGHYSRGNCRWISRAANSYLGALRWRALAKKRLTQQEIDRYERASRFIEHGAM